MEKSNYFLVTTAIPENKKYYHEKILYLGEWCKIFNDEKCSKCDSKTVPYHWNDRKKLHDDAIYIDLLYEKYLIELTIILNDIHCVDYDTRYWRILIGPWLTTFFFVVFDRFEILKLAVENYSIKNTIIYEFEENEVHEIPNDINDFFQMITTDTFNQNIFSILIKNHTKINYTSISQNNNENFEVNNYDSTLLNRLLKEIANSFFNFLNKFSKKINLFTITTYLPFYKNIILQLSMFQIPRFWKTEQLPKVKLNPTTRGKFRYKLINGSLQYKNTSCFEKTLPDMISRLMPIVYLEGYLESIKKIESGNFSKKTKYIFTSNSFFMDDYFKLWCSQQVFNGSKLITGQHGGHFGIGKWNSVEKHQIKISDKYLTWGWNNKNYSNIKSIGFFKTNLFFNNNFKKNNLIYLVCAIHPRYSYMSYSVPIGEQWISYFNDQFSFVNKLDQDIQNQLVVRLYIGDYDWKQELRWKNALPNIQIDNGKSNYKQILKKSRIFVSTYNATTFLESIFLDIPTVIYWDTNYWELNTQAEYYFNELKNVKIFHSDPISAAIHINNVYNNVETWWYSKDVRDILEKFKSNYIYKNSDIVKDVIENIIQ